MWLPWTENPDDPDAVEVQERYGLVEEVLHARSPERASQFGIRKQDAEWLRYRIGFCGAKRRYLPDGKRLSIPGTHARVNCYGPPKDPAFFRREEATERLLRAAAPSQVLGQNAPLFSPQHVWEPIGRKPLEEEVVTDDDLFGAANKLMNNRSLILLIRYGNAGILLPGDAEQGCWMGAFDTTGLERQIDDVTVLKVAHHGSSNATPRRLVEALKGRKVTSLLSTEPGVSGKNPEDSVVKALGSLGKVIRSDKRTTRSKGWHDLQVG